MARTKKVAASVSAVPAAAPVTEEVKEVAVKTDASASEVTKTEGDSTGKTRSKAERKTPAKKTPVKKEAVENKVSLFLQYSGKQFSEEEIIEKAKTAAAAEAGMKRLSTIKTIEIYCKPEEHAAYYVANGGKIVGRIDL